MANKKVSANAAYANASITGAITNVGLGLYLDRPQWQIPPGGLASCSNVRVYQQRLTSFGMGWTSFGLSVPLNGPVTLIDTFIQSTGIQIQIFGTPTDLYQYVSGGTPNIEWITPYTSTGTVSITHGSAALTGSGTTWSSANYPVKAGDRVFLGTANKVDPSSTPWYTVQTVNSDTSITLTANYTGTTLSGAAVTIRQLFTGNALMNVWASETFPNANYNNTTEDVWMATNGSDYPVIWNGVTTAVTYLYNFPFKCFNLRRFQDTMCYGGLVNASGVYQPNGFANSDAATPAVLNSGVAGQYTITDDNYIINAMQPLGNVLMLYTNGEVVSAQWVGAPTNWVFTKVIRGRGLVAGRTVAVFPDRHEFIGQDGQYRYNGLYVQLMNLQVWRSILSNFDLSRANRGFALVNEQYGDILWALPLTTDANNPGLNTAYAEHYLEMPQSYLQKPYTQRDFPFTCSGSYTQQSPTTTWNLLTGSWQTYQTPWNSNLFTGSFPLTLVGDTSGNVWTLYSADTQNGSAYLSTATFGQRLIANERSRGLVSRVYPGVAYNATGYPLTVSLTMYDQVGGKASFTDVQTIATNYSGNRFTTHYRRGRLGQVTFSTPGPSQPWELQGFDWDARMGGLR